MAWGASAADSSPASAAARAAQGQDAGTTPSRPNILWITCEDMSPDLGCYGNAESGTPHLDRLASQGTRFSNVYTVAPVCAPSRSALITGCYPTQIGTLHMRSKAVPPPEVKCFTEYLRAAGYYCTNNAKTDYNFASPRTAWDRSGRNAHWRNRPPGTPFFAVFNLTITHESKFHIGDAEFARLTEALPPERRHRPEDVTLPPYYPDTPVVRRDWARYLDMISVMDLQAGEILAQLEEDGLTSSTIVFFFSDHGRGLPRGKRWVYDSGIWTPLLVRWPGTLSPGSVNEELVSFIDFAPTVLSLAGVPVPAHMRGRIFLGKEKGPEPEFVFAARDRMDTTLDTIRAVRDRRWKYIRNFAPEKPYAQVIAYGEKTPTMQELRRLHADGQLSGAQTLFFRPSKPVEELYDTLADPHEVRDLASLPEHAGRLARMRQALADWQRETGDLGLIPEEELLERMRPGGRWEKTAAPVITREADSSSSGVVIRITCPTPGASIAWRPAGDQAAPWRLYSGPLRLEPPAAIAAVACRLGFEDSEVARLRIEPAQRD